MFSNTFPISISFYRYNDFSSNLRSLLTGRDVKGNSPFHIAARMTDGSLGTFLKDFVNLYSDKVCFMNSLQLSLLEPPSTSPKIPRTPQTLFNSPKSKNYEHCNVVCFINYKAYWLFKELLLKNEQDQNPFHIAAKSGNTDNDDLSRLA